MSAPTTNRPATGAGDGLDVQAVAGRYPQVVAKLAAAEGITETDAAQRVIELVKYLTIATDCDQPVVPSRAVDVAWHTFILFTRDYAAFCTETFGRFVHHQPTEPGAGDPDAYPRTHALLADRFGPPDPRLWPAAGAGGDCQTEGNCKADCSGDCTGGS
ncbi:hypothetical protein SAMN05661080_04705 [Modestobacter sp. DSM 44400]|uniref:glycine-rich domain-containing protein n=1 Tax=Modestobacter sp. DSM 44400 TaxID=1550230 RepID=UPI000898693E|nr:hypothetical protein [Modestobacter sp. DSM 44400]SDY81814.1 hypothetical protein SAMN05661080_04705 [Modestobacter sp. DSM 44400]